MNKICKSCKSKDIIKINLFNQCIVSDGSIIKNSLIKSFCKACGLGFGKNRYKLSNYYRTDGSSKFELERHKKIAKGIYDIIKKNHKKTNLILEIGAANFQTSYNLSRLDKHFNVHALEPFPENENQFDDVLNIKSEFFDFKTNLKYDVIFSNNVIEHIRDIKHFLKKTDALLDEDGLIIVCCPSFMQISTELLFADHVWHITSLSMENLCNEVNLYLSNHFVSKWDIETHVYIIKKGKLLTKEKKYFNELINLKRLSFYKKWIEADSKISEQITQKNFVIFGAGEFTQLIKVYMPKTFKLAKYILVNNDVGHRLFNKPILNIDKLDHRLKKTQILLGVKKNNRNKIIKVLKSYGVKEENILETFI